MVEKIQNSFDRKISADKSINVFLEKTKSGKANLKELSLYGRALGEHLADSLLEHLNRESLPDETLYFNIANRIIDATMHNNYELVNEAGKIVQKAIDEAAGIGLNAVKAPYPEERIMQVINGLSDKTAEWETIQRRMDEPIRNISQTFVDDFIKANADFRSKSGMKTEIVRTTVNKCCDWCENLAGSYSYPADVPDDVFKRHDDCRCTVTFKSHKRSEIIHRGNEGQRRYVKDKYGSYVLTKEARIERAKKMAATEDARKEAARKKRIATWQRKKEEQAKEKSAKIVVAKSNESDIIKSFEIGKSIGAASKNYPVKLPDSRQHTKLAEGQTIKGEAFAGKGTSREIRDRFRLEATYNIPADEWQKVSGKGYAVVNGKNVKAELHWYEARGEIVEMKVKRFYDESKV